jgi:WD40-like Beta Propeller Repeat
MSMKNITSALVACILVLSMPVLAQSNFEEKLLLADKQYDLYAYQLAIKTYTEVLDVQPNHVHALSQLGKCHLQVADAAKAVTYFERAVALPGFDDAIPLHYGQALMMLGEYGKAKVWFGLYAENNEIQGKHFVDVSNWAAQNASAQSDYQVKSELLNTSQTDFLPAFYGNKIVFGSMRGDIVSKQVTGHQNTDWAGGNASQLFASEVDSKSGYLQRPVLLKGDLQTSYHEGPAVFSLDGKQVAFCRNNFVNGNRQIAEKGMNLSLYTATVVGGAWTNVRAFPHNGSDFSTGFPAFSPDGKQLYHSSNRPNSGQGGWDIYVSEWTGTTWSAPASLGSDINTPGNEVTPYVEGNTFYFSSDWHAGYGGLDIFSCAVDGTRFSELKNMGLPVNSPMDDYGFIYQSRNAAGYFTSSRAGGKGNEDIYKCTRKSSDYLITVINERGETISGAVIDLTKCGKSIYTTSSDGKFKFANATLAEACTATVTLDGYKTAFVDIKPTNNLIEVKLTPTTAVAAPAMASVKTPAPQIEKTKEEAASPMLYSFDTKVKKSSGTSAQNAPKVAVIEQKVLPVDVKKEVVVVPAPVVASIEKSAVKSTAPAAKTESVPQKPAPVEMMDGYAIQVMSLASSAPPETPKGTFDMLTQYGNVYEKITDGKRRVRVGVYEDMSTAQSILSKIKKTNKKATIVEEKSVQKSLAFKQNDQPDAAQVLLADTKEENILDTKQETAKTTVAVSAAETKTQGAKLASKTVDTPALATKKGEPELVISRYAVQLAAYETNGDAFNVSDYMPVSDLGKIYTVPAKDLTRVRLGVWEDPSRAEAAKKEAVKRGFKDALVVNEKSTAITDKLLIKDTQALGASKKEIAQVAEKPVTAQKPTKYNTPTSKEVKTPVPSAKVLVTQGPSKVPEQTPAAPATKYMLRVAAHKDPKTFDDMYIAGIPAEKEVRKSGKISIIYLKGFAKLEDALDAKKTLSNRGMKDAYIVKDEDGKITPLQF